MSQLTDSKKFLHTLKAWNSARIFPFQCYTKLKIPATGKRVSMSLIGQFKAHRLLIGCFRESLKQINQKRKRKTNKQTRTTRTFNNKKEINWNALFFRVFFFKHPSIYFLNLTKALTRVFSISLLSPCSSNTFH